MDDKEKKKSFYYEVPEEDINKAAAAINKQLKENYKSVKITTTHTKNDNPYYVQIEKVYKGPWPATVTQIDEDLVSTHDGFIINKYTIQDKLIIIETVAPYEAWISYHFSAKNNEFKVETSFCTFKECHFFEYSGLNVKFRCKKGDYIGKPYFPYKDIITSGPTDIYGNYLKATNQQIQPDFDLDTIKKLTEVFDWSLYGKNNYDENECKVEVVTLPKSLRTLKHNNSPNLIFNLTSFKKVYCPGSHIRIAEIFLYTELNKSNHDFIIYFSDSPISLYNIDIYFRECRLAAYNQHKTKFVFTCKKVEDLGSNNFLETEDNKVDILKEIVEKKEPSNDLLVDLIDV